MKKWLWPVLVFLAIAIGFYPVAYFLFDMRMALLSTKPASLLADNLYTTLFYVHISFGGLSLLIGWSQFVKRFRNRFLKWHRRIGKFYLIAVSISGSAGLYIAMFATGGIISILGFACLAIGWLFSSAMAYRFILRKNIDDHERWMIRSYAFTFAAVTLRIWLPLMDFGMAMDFFVAYRIVAWLCWVPNWVVAELIISGMRSKLPTASAS